MKLVMKSGKIKRQFRTKQEMYRYLCTKGDAPLREWTVVCGCVKWMAIDWQQRAYGQLDMKRRIAARS